MKKLLFSLSFLFVADVIAVCNNQYVGEIVEFLDSSIWYNNDGGAFLHGFPTLVNGEVSYFLEDGYNCEQKESKRSFLDSNNAFLYRRQDSYSQMLSVVVLDASTFLPGDIFRDEFLHWQRCGMLSLSYEEADSVVTPLVKAMNEYFTEEDNSGEFSSQFFRATPDYIGLSKQINQWMEQSCEAAPLPQSSSVSHCQIVFMNGLIQIPPELQGKHHFMFDLNGQTLQSGKLEQNVTLPRHPVILKIDGQREIFIRN